MKGTSRLASDLDLVGFVAKKDLKRVPDLKEAFEESNLPFRADFFIWDEVPEAFREKIKAG